MVDYATPIGDVVHDSEPLGWASKVVGPLLGWVDWDANGSVGSDNESQSTSGFDYPVLW